MQRCLEDLAHAIIVQAAEDYRKAQKKLKVFLDHKEAQAVIREIERFFNSRWYAQLTDIDGKMLLKRLKEEAR